MPDFSNADFPCPHCLQGIQLDEATAGREIACPHCHETVQLPKLPEKHAAAVNPKPIINKRGRNQGGKQDQGSEESVALPLPVELAEVPVPELPPAVETPVVVETLAPELTAEDEDAGLPSKEKSREEEIRRLASMAGNVDYDLAKFQRKGMLTFACPRCHRPMWVAKKDVGAILDCEGCSAEVVTPRPELGLPAQLAEQQEAGSAVELPKAILPTARRVEDVTLKEGQAGGRARRMAPLPQEPTIEQAARGAGPSTPTRSDYKIAPVPARGDESLSGAPVVLPSERISTARTVGGKRQSDPVPAPEPVYVPEEPVRPISPREPKQAKGAVRLNNQRRVFAPQKEISSDLEVTESWGQSDSKPPLSRRYMIIAVLTMIPIILGLLIWGMKEVFRKKPVATVSHTLAKDDKNEADIVRLAQAVLTKFHDAKTIDEMARYVRHPEITKPRMEGWYQRPFPRFTVESFGNAQVSNVEGVEFIIGDLQLSGERSKSIALETPDENGVGTMADDLRIDWESMVCWSEMTSDSFLAQESERACDFRVVLRRDSYPNAPYDDESRWICFKINFPNGNFCYGYVELNSDVATEMIQPLRRASENGVESLNATLRLRFRPDARGRKNLVPQVSIERFRDGWLRVEGQ